MVEALQGALPEISSTLLTHTRTHARIIIVVIIYYERDRSIVSPEKAPFIHETKSPIVNLTFTPAVINGAFTGVAFTFRCNTVSL